MESFDTGTDFKPSGEVVGDGEEKDNANAVPGSSPSAE
jgi:hypothetical protein